MIGRFLEFNLQHSRKSQLLHCELIWTFEQQFSLYFHSRSPSQENVNSRQRQTRTGAKCKNFSFLLWFRWTKVLKVHSNRRSIYLDIQTWSLLFTKIWPIRELDLEHVTKISQWKSENSDYYLDIGVYCLQKFDQSRSLNSHTWPKLANEKARILIDFNIAATRCNESKNVKIYREQNLTNQIEGFGSRDQNWPIRDEYFAFSRFFALNGRSAKYSFSDWAVFVTWPQ